MTVSFTIDELPKFRKWVRQSAEAAVKRGLVSAAMRGVGVIQNEIIPAEKPPPVDVGAYRAGWHHEATERGADLVNSLPYASVIEYGARAENIKIGGALIAALTAWVLRKGLAGKRTGADSKTEARQIAWAIAVSMKRRGIFNRGGQSGLRVGEKALRKIRAFLVEEVQRELRRVG